MPKPPESPNPFWNMRPLQPGKPARPAPTGKPPAYYRLALKHAELLPPAEHAILLEAFAEETNAFDQRLDSIAAYQQALEIWRSLGDASRQGSLLASLTSMMTARGQDAAAESYARQAIAILEGIPPGLALADAYRKKAFIELGNRNFDQALGWIEKSAALVESQGSKKDAFRAQLLSGLVWLHRDYPRGCQIMEQAARNARATGQMILRGSYLCEPGGRFL